MQGHAKEQDDSVDKGCHFTRWEVRTQAVFSFWFSVLIKVQDALKWSNLSQGVFESENGCL